MSVTNPPAANILIYDGECFFCRNYIRLVQLQASIGPVTLINARDTEAVKPWHMNTAELNEGILLILGEQRYFGADAIHRIALLSTSSTVFNRINRLIFSSHWLATALYPLLKLGRRIYLLLAGKDLIR